jgi:hypothetical protein
MTDLEMLNAVEEWPHWPILPLKRFSNTKQQVVMAVAVEATTEGDQRFLLLVGKNMMEKITEFDLREGIKCNAEEIVDLGWHVD